MRRKPFWISFTISFVVLGPLLATIGFLIGFGRGMRSFGSPSSPSGMIALIELLVSLPLPADAVPVWVFNGVCWAMLLSFLLATAIAKFSGARGKQSRGFPVDVRPPGKA